jgi:uncharacterized protein (TIGR00725 family)
MTLYIGVAGASRPEVMGEVAAGVPEAPRPEVAGGGGGAARPGAEGEVPGAARPERPGAAAPDLGLLEQAERLGRRLAEAGAVVVCGGGPGVMEAVCRGARSAGGTTVGLLPGLDRGDANPHLSVSVPTGMGQGRNLLLVRSSDALVAVGGGFGTLSEIALALRTGTPVIGLATWSLQLHARPVEAFPVADDADAAARLALEAARSRRADPTRPQRDG